MPAPRMLASPPSPRSRTTTRWMTSEPAQQRGIGFEEELVEVPVGAFARTKNEVALEIGRGDQVAPELTQLGCRGLHALNLAEGCHRPWRSVCFGSSCTYLTAVLSRASAR